MCGIAGFVGPANPAALRGMAERLRHRGPDGEGFHSAGAVHLAHRRLAIVDAAGGAQPFLDERHGLAIVFNGEIYNHLELRKELAAAGHAFRTRSDTETLLAAYAAWGAGALPKLRGMFAFAIHDARRNVLFAARDAFGEKPFHYLHQPGQPTWFAFASETQAFAAHPELAPALAVDHDAALRFLAHDYVPGEQTIHAGVRRLPPGCSLTLPLAGGELRIERWHQPDYTPTALADPQELLRLLDQAVARQLMSDVPLGVFLSGGIDSAAVVALLARHRPAGAIDTFAIGFDDPSFDESAHAAAAAQDLGTRHHTRTFTARDLLEQLPRTFAQLGEPFADPSILPVALLCGFARERVTVALGGDGGDELFAGYDPFRALAPARRYARWVPAWCHRHVSPRLASLLPVRGGNMELAFKARRFLRGVAAAPRHRPALWMAPFDPAGLAALFPACRDRIRLDALFPECAALPADDGAAALRFFQETYLPDDILFKVDRAAMAHSLEVRCPFLDGDLAAYANALPFAAKLAGGQTKVLLRQALRSVLKPAILRRPKKGFGIPAARWLRSELKGEFEARVLSGWPTDLPSLDRAAAAALWRRHQDQRENHYKELWALLALAWWRQTR